jgi:uncharacterized membrane protein
MRRMLRTRAYWAGLLLGVAAMAAVDEIVFHQLLGWHHFYDRSTPDIALISDGLLHAGELVVAVIGVLLLMDARRRSDLRGTVVVSGLLVGAGLFQLWDGIVDHKLLRVHQVRYGVELLPYDIAWNAAGLALLVAGAVTTAMVARRPPNIRDRE